MFGYSIYLIKTPNESWWSKWPPLDEKQTIVAEYEVGEEMCELLHLQVYIPKEK